MKKFTYEGNAITFATGDNVMMNATQMCKSFGKTPKDWLRTNQAQDFINTLSAVRQKCLTDLVVVYQGGSSQGTWMHEDVAIEFARWLSPKFAIWCNDRIKDMVRGTAAPRPKALPARMRTKPRDRSAALGDFYRELRMWTRSRDVDEVAEMASVKRKSVLDVLRGGTMSVEILELLVAYAKENRRERRLTDIVPARAVTEDSRRRLEQLRIEFMEEGGAL